MASLDHSNNNTIYGNNITINSVDGIFLWDSNYNTIYANNITANVRYGVQLFCSEYNTFRGNDIENNGYGVYLDDGSGYNVFYHNNFVDNTVQVEVWMAALPNVWDNGYPSGGNYWSDYTGIDLYSGVYQNVTGNDGIGDTPYVIDGNNRDNYPLMKPYSPHDIGITSIVTSKTVVGQGYNVFISVTVENQGDYAETFKVFAYYDELVIPTPDQWETFWSMGDVNRDGYIDGRDLALINDAYGSTPGDPNWNPDADLNKDLIVDPLDLAILGMHYGFNIWTYFGLGTPPIGTQIVVNLPNGTFTTVTFTWNTTGFAKGNYTIKAVADTVAGETETGDNTYTDDTVLVSVPGDVDGDRNVDIDDLLILIDHFWEYW